MSRLPLVLALAAALAALALALLVGPGELGPGDVAAILGHHLGLVDAAPPPIADAIIWELRLPRALLAAVIGAALGGAGAITQGLFRNPLAEPGVLGISSGAALFAVIGFALGLDAATPWAAALLAAGGATSVLLLLLAFVGARIDVATLLLSGVAVAALASAVTTLILALASARWDLGLRVIHWLMGSFEGRSWGHLAIAAPIVSLGLGLSLWIRRDLDVLFLGPESARSLGVDLRRLHLQAIAAIGLLVGVATALTGIIGFIGLIVPHLARRLGGPGHRRLIPLSAAIGGGVLLLVDTGARAFTSFVLPPGVITSLLGAPFFLWILWRQRVRVDGL
ncbi:MAG: iron ABC transporter permease [Myxococcales bacterium]|nr:iron ABC transporter permease [Myxococcales bacterium]